MTKSIIYFILLIVFTLSSCKQMAQNNTKYNKLNADERNVIINKGTEAPFKNEYFNFKGKGTYLCKQCYTPLFLSDNKFDSGCGWPSFDEEIPQSLLKTTDADGVRTGITCKKCGAHIGHVFLGEEFTAKNTRHCANSISLLFMKEKSDSVHDTAIFASGCFWGTEYYFQKLEGVISTQVGYTGGHTTNPTYKEVCSGTTGHLEAVKVVFDSSKIDYEKVCKYFFETHDFTQTNGQGPDIGEQYLSAIFYTSMEQKKIAEKIINILIEKNYKVATMLIPAKPFWPAEEYHQDYYINKGATPYCHIYTKIF